MLKKILLSFSLAIQNIRSRLLHTFLSILGIVIGVAALVAILSLIDGMEKYAHRQITSTTSLNSLIIQTEINKKVDNVWLKKEKYHYLTYEDFIELEHHLHSISKGSIIKKVPKEIHIAGKNKTIGADIFWIAVTKGAEGKLACGNHIANQNMNKEGKYTIINKTLSSIITGDTIYKDALEKHLIVGSDSVEVIGVLAENSSSTSEAFIPISLLSEAELKNDPPQICLKPNSFRTWPH